MGCDGVWDCVKRQLVCDFVDREIIENLFKIIICDINLLLKKI